jgi:hypothetical protein
MLRMLSAGMTVLAVMTASSLGHAQSRFTGSEPPRISAADLNALTDARVAIIKSTLQLTPDQEKYWPAIEEAMRARAKTRQTRLENLTTGAADRGPIETIRDRNPVEFLNRRADALAQRAADLKKLAAAWQPLYQTLTPDQKRRMGLLAMSALRELRSAVEERRMQVDDEEDE